MKRKITLFISLLLMGISLLSAQNSTISGVVVDSNGDPIVGASVSIKGTTKGAISNMTGAFSLSNVDSKSSTLVVTYIGMVTQELASKSGSMRIVMKDDSTILDEVVVTAMGIQRQERSLGYTVSKVKADETIQKAEPDLLRSLDGKIPGVSISAPSGAAGSSTRVTIRGNSSFLGSNQPLYVVDGVPYSNSEVESSGQAAEAGGAYGSGISTLDPNDIETMNVLKGAAASALYGSRASNGVILITTKTGSKEKKKSKGTEITFNASYTTENIIGLPDYQNKFGTGNSFVAGSSNGSWGASFDDVTEVPISIYSNNVYQNAYPDLPDMIPYKAYKNNVKDLFNTGGIYDLSLNLNKYTKTGNFAMTLSKLQQDSYIPNAEYGRYGISLGGNETLENGIRFGGNVSFSRNEQDGPMYGNNQSSDIGASSFARALILGRNWDMSLPYETPTGASLFFVDSQADNPIWSWKYNKIHTQMDRTVANASMGYDFTDWLSVDYRIGINDYKMDRKEILNLGSRALGGKGRILMESYDTQEIESILLLGVDKKINDDFNIKGTIGHNVNQYTTKNSTIKGANIISPGVYNINNTQSQTVVERNTQQRLWALFAEATLGYKNYAFLSITGRNDFSSTLPTNNRSYFYPSFSGSFVFSEALKIKQEYLDFGKIRLSWAKVGKDASPYYNNGTYSLEDPYMGKPILSLPYSQYDPKLKPEFTTEIEFGTELQFLNKRANIDFTYYNKNSTDQIAPLSLPGSTGYGKYYTNFGKMNNKGVEIGVNLVPVLNKDWKWTTFLNYTKNTSKIIELTAGLDRIEIPTGFTQPGVVLEVGQPYGMLVGTVLERDDEGNPLIDPNSGFYLVAEKEGLLGNPAPDYKISMGNTIAYKNITFSFMVDAQVGGCVWTSYLTDLLGRGVTKDTENRYGSRILPGYLADTQTRKPLLDQNGNKIPNNIQLTESDLWFSPGGDISSFAINGADEMAVYDATTFKLRELSIGYTVPTKYLKNTPIGSINISFVARNLWYYAPNVPKYSNYDPTVSSYGGSNVQGIDFTTAPNTRRFGFNLRVTL